MCLPPPIWGSHKCTYSNNLFNHARQSVLHSFVLFLSDTGNTKLPALAACCLCEHPVLSLAACTSRALCTVFSTANACYRPLCLVLSDVSKLLLQKLDMIYIATVNIGDGTLRKVNCKYSLYNFTQYSIYAKYAQRHISGTANSHLFSASGLFEDDMSVQPKLQNMLSGALDCPTALETWRSRMATMRARPLLYECIKEPFCG